MLSEGFTSISECIGLGQDAPRIASTDNKLAQDPVSINILAATAPEMTGALAAHMHAWETRLYSFMHELNPRSSGMEAIHVFCGSRHGMGKKTSANMNASVPFGWHAWSLCLYSANQVHA